MKWIHYFQYNSIVILSYFFLSLFVLILSKITKGKSNELFISGRDSIWNPLTYIKLFTHVLGHQNWNHFRNNFLYILLIGPMIEEKYGSIHLFIMILITAVVTGILNIILSRKRILGASGISFMLILLSSLVNLQTGRIPITFVLIFIFYIISEVMDGIFKKDQVSHFSHIVGAICGFIYGYYVF